MTDSGWVDMYSAEGESVQADPSNYIAGVVIQGGDGYWYSMDTNNNWNLWTTSGWQPTTVPAEDDPNIVTIGPPTAGNSVSDFFDVAMASGDPNAIALAHQLQDSHDRVIEMWLEPSNSDGDSKPDSSDWNPIDSSVQDAGDFYDDTDY
jgi:hypothetical protein